MAIVAVEAVPAKSKPPAAVSSICIFTGGGYNFVASALLLTKASLMHLSEVKGG